METLLRNYRNECLDSVLDLLWRQWTALGVPGYQLDQQIQLVDPEALIALTCSLGRFDQRLFDEVLEWLLANARYINTQRLRGLFSDDGFQQEDVAGMVARFVFQRTALPKWRSPFSDSDQSSEERHLFLLRDGTGLPVVGERDPAFLASGWIRNPFRSRNHGQPFPAHEPAALLLRLRGLFGVSARCEVVAYLLCNGTGNASEIARTAHYSQKTVHDLLADLERSGFVESSRRGRERIYRICSAPLLQALHGSPPRWMDWAEVLADIERMWLGLDAISRSSENDLARLQQIHGMFVSFMQCLHTREMFGRVDAPAVLTVAEGLLRPLSHTLAAMSRGAPDIEPIAAGSTD